MIQRCPTVRSMKPGRPLHPSDDARDVDTSSPLMSSSSFDNSLMIYMKNEVGVAIPIYVKTSDKVERIYMEAANAPAINRGSLRGKAFYHNGTNSVIIQRYSKSATREYYGTSGRRLSPHDLIGDVGIAFYDTVRLKTVEESLSEKEIRQQEEDYPLTNDHEGPIE
ncbi:hypothetical protein OSTOST_00658 [Ostertagia ostertagi]